MASLKAVFTAARLLAEKTGISLKATVTALALKAEVTVGFFLRFFFIADAGSASDSDAKEVGKPFTESTSVTDDDLLEIGKGLLESPAFSDVDILAVAKGLSEAPGATEQHALVLGRLFANSGAVTESASLRPVKIETDSAGATDNDTLDVAKDVGGDTAQDYCDVTYFLEDYTVGDRLDRIFLGDDQEFAYLKNITDQIFVTDDLDGEASTEDDQEIDFVKTRTEIIGLTDVFERDVAFARNFTEAPAANDDQTLAVAKTISKTPTATESVAKILTFTKTDVGGLADTDVLNTGKNLSDNGGIIDAQVVQFAKVSSDSGVASDSGNLRSQSYCNFTYFAEDYVGASRTFT